MKVRKEQLFMAGINFNDLPKNLQAKLEPFMTVAGSVENAIEAAKLKGTWTSADTEAMNALNGGANWGKTMDEYAFHPEKADEYAKNAPEAKKQNELAQARKRNAARQEVEAKFAERDEAQKKLAEARNDLKRTIVSKRSQGVMGYLSAIPDQIKLDRMPKPGVNEAGVGALKWLAAPLLAAVAVAFTSCDDKNEMPAQIDVTQIVSVPITIPMKDYTPELLNLKAELQGLRGDMDKYNKQAVDKFNEIIDKLSEISDNGETTNAKFQQLLDDISYWMDLVTKNQIAIKTSNDTNFQELFSKLDEIVKSTSLSVQQKYERLMELLAQIKQVGETISAKMDTVIAQLAQSLGNDETIIALLKKLDKNDENILSALVTINNAINQLGQEFAPYFKSIISGLAENNAKADETNRLLAAIKENTDNIKALMVKYGDAGVGLGNAILNYLKGLDFSKIVDLSGVEALLKNLVSGQQTTNANITNLTALFNKFGADVNTKLNTIINKIKGSKDYEAQLNQIIDLLGKLDANNETRNKKVLDAIDKLGVNISTSLTAILNKIGQGGQDGKDYSSVLNAILAKLGTIDGNNTKNFNKVIEALGKLSIGQTTDVNLQPILDKLEEILKAIKDHKVTVDVTGKVTCECNCGSGSVHEGILGDLNNLLG